MRLTNNDHNNSNIINATNGDCSISTDKDKLDVPFVHSFLSKEAYWSLNIPFDTVERSVAGSLCFGVYHDPSSTQVGFARIITDFATIAYLGNVFITAPHRGKASPNGLSGRS